MKFLDSANIFLYFLFEDREKNWLEGPWSSFREWLKEWERLSRCREEEDYEVLFEKIQDKVFWDTGFDSANQLAGREYYGAGVTEILMGRKYINK